MSLEVYIVGTVILCSLTWGLVLLKVKLVHSNAMGEALQKQMELSLRLEVLEGIDGKFAEMTVERDSLNKLNIDLRLSLEAQKGDLAELVKVRELNQGLEERCSRLQVEVAQLNTTLSSEQANHEEKIKILTEAKENLSESFQLIAKKIFSEQTKEWSSVSQEKIGHLLKPLQERLKGFETQVKQNHESSITRNAAMIQELKRLQELNQQVSLEATNLTKALKGESKTQGCWGEMILERILESAGLEKGIEYTVQESFLDESSARKQPDAIIKLPENKQIVVDSKVSIKAYEQYCQVNDPEDGAKLARAHCASIQKHIKELSSKNYQSLKEINCVDMVLMFIPIEPALGLALQECPTLFDDAMRKNIVLVTPSTLLATMRTVAYIWRHEKQNKNALKIAEEGGKFYDKLVGFVEDMEKLGSQLGTASKTYTSSMNKLLHGKGNLVRRAESIRELGVVTNKRLSKKVLDQSSQLPQDTLEVQV
jgi:DNA recombination protein RmuC